ncbi:variable surface protein Vir30, putative [Plasmodium vivax]|uniref:Variable surface protein Vir30, putative n=1 Tax=Plasmodium vivax (strain Salvador I) TaxID=126793 RepID=A5KDA6_PLAVS|nr:variable surface protein Vir30, putative [Plasmodium vivax]EDL42663.1 variable surface protein Vir30, putative [Plasmodium vivax]|eukprot:XP_001612456.1 variable surface protein Vir30 [Plasmodium vivax Sal-1]
MNSLYLCIINTHIYVMFITLFFHLIKFNKAKCRYDFFDNISNYMKDGKSIEDTVRSVDASKYCDSFSSATASQLGDKENAKYICEIFTKLCNHFPNCKKQEQNTSYKQNCGLLNYWLNMKLNDDKINGKTCVLEIENTIQSQCSDIFEFNFDSLNFLYDIKKEELHKMNILYSLYQNYSKLKNIIENKSGPEKTSLLPHSTACCADYNKAKYICSDDNNKITFCKKLVTFESKYDELYNTFKGKKSEFSDDLIKLSECTDNKIITTAVTGTVVGLIPLFGVLYKFTPMGQLLKSKIGILNNDISNNDEEYTKISLMEQESDHISSRQGTYNIKYQTL